MQNLFKTSLARIFLLVLLFSACAKKTSEKDVEKNLMEAMQKFLTDNPKVDKSTTKFDVLDVTFFEDKKFYRCEFKVHLKSAVKDTTGIMTADVSKDFERVFRKS